MAVTELAGNRISVATGKRPLAMECVFYEFAHIAIAIFKMECTFAVKRAIYEITRISVPICVNELTMSIGQIIVISPIMTIAILEIKGPGSAAISLYVVSFVTAVWLSVQRPVKLAPAAGLSLLTLTKPANGFVRERKQIPNSAARARIENPCARQSLDRKNGEHYAEQPCREDLCSETSKIPQ